jgi:hypothetical protein
MRFQPKGVLAYNATYSEVGVKMLLLRTNPKGEQDALLWKEQNESDDKRTGSS